ncbi:MAG: carboxy-S-adenosyl-L-methionine synthase CmoA [Fuerstiella sp.]|nr:carboxy-S-adenosyl-L-methionine synthase CmoA [Fuerstiella sp.]
MNQDRIYSKPLARIEQFEFDDSVARVFPDMIARSVPGYASMLAMVEQITLTHAAPNSQLYDLGCSLGAATERMRLRAPTSCTLHAVDNSHAMITRLRNRLKETSGTTCEIITHENDIRSVSVENASVVVLNLTLQFVPCRERLPLLRSIYAGMRPGGALLVSEKVCFDDLQEQQLMTELHLDFKRAHGYSELEIAQKRAALEESLITETLAVHVDRIKACGFCQAGVWLRHFNFASMIAIR